ncbi:hypothetical protein MJ904_04035 [Massilia sp. MB5]|uniref:hypothetical protein n=1 Tax=Massilia sp. MB5 TaxID=2919578 RepID=UPI001F0D2627|nr:hypothetical protein [Massilia sp. MB5]UMR31415.1 hypothetical protein MJ904_04035 [Massilia sp. MB5]
MGDIIYLILMGVCPVAIYYLIKTRPRGTAQPTAPKAEAAPDTPALPQTAPARHWSDEGRFQLEVVAESRYQATIRQLAGAHGEQSANARHPAILAPDDMNAYEATAVAVFLSGQMVGYLEPKQAAAFRRLLAQQELEGQPTSCDALIRGGGLWEGKRLSYSVSLDVEPLR